MAEKRPSGFTLVELLVVIAIIGVLVAMLLPAVQAAREAAKRAQCKSRLRNLALAVHNYQSANNVFPPGFISQPNREEAWGWTTFVLPFLEEEPLYEGLGVSERRLADLFIQSRGGPGVRLVQTPLPIFRCPADDTPDLLPGSGSGDRHFRGNNTPSGFEPATSNYVGLKGYEDIRCPANQAPQGCATSGIFFGESDISFKDITDGTSHTFLVGERDSHCKSGTWIGSRNPPGAGMFGSYMLIARVSIKLNHPSTGAHNTCTEGFSSAHTGGGHFALCDASVRFVSEDIDFNNGGNPRDQVRNSEGLGLYQRLGMRNDALPLAESDFR